MIYSSGVIYVARTHAKIVKKLCDTPKKISPLRVKEDTPEGKLHEVLLVPGFSLYLS